MLVSSNNYNGSSDCQESAKRSSVMAVAQQYYSLGNATVVHAFGNCRSLYFIVLKKHLDRYWAMSIERSQASTASGIRNASRRPHQHNSNRLSNKRINKSIQSQHHKVKYNDSIFCCFSVSSYPPRSNQSGKMSLHSHFEPREYKRGSPRRRRDPTFDLLCKAREILSTKYANRCRSNLSLPGSNPELGILCNFFGIATPCRNL